MRPELALVLECIGPARSRTQSVAPDLDWDSVLATARRHQVLPELEHTLGAWDWSGVPSEVRTELKAYVAALDVRNAYLTSTLVDVLRALERRGVRTLAFKGPALAALYEPPGRRAYGDLDLLISIDDIASAEATLRGLDFRLDPPFVDPTQVAFVAGLTGWRKLDYLRSRSEHHFRRDADRILVDLHVKLADPFIRVPLHFEDLYARSERLRLLDHTVRMPGTEDMLLILSVNAAKDSFAKLRSFRDVAQLVRVRPEVDWSGLFERADHLGIRRMLEVTLRLTQRLTQTPLTAGARSDPVVPRLTSAAIDRLTSETPRPPLFSRAYTRLQLRARERLADRLWYCLYLALAPGVSDWMFIPLPERLRCLYALVRPIRLAAHSTPARRIRAGRLRPG